MKEYVHWLKGGKRQFRKQEITSRSNYEMVMLYTFLWCMICVPLKLNVMKKNLVALLSEHPSYLNILFWRKYQKKFVFYKTKVKIKIKYKVQTEKFLFIKHFTFIESPKLFPSNSTFANDVTVSPLPPRSRLTCNTVIEIVSDTFPIFISAILKITNAKVCHIIKYKKEQQFRKIFLLKFFLNKNLSCNFFIKIFQQK